MAGIRTRVTWNDVQPQIRTAMRKGIHDALEHVLDESNAITPHDEGILEGTGTITLDPNKLKGVISYNTPYAIRLHEHPEYSFQRGRKGKWLEITVKQEKKKVQAYLHNKIKQGFK